MPQPGLSAFTAARLAAYGAASTVAATGVVLSAFRQRSNFYAAAVLLGRSNGCMLVLLNFAVFLTFMFGKACQKVFFGPLRPVEVEHIYERSWYAVTESLLAMTIFRDDFDASFIMLFGSLLFLKIFHWLSSDRVEFMEQSPSVNRLFHARMISLLWTLFCLDLFLVAFALEIIILDRRRMGIMIMFASEFMILTATLWATIAKYIINCRDMRSEEPWEAKSMWIFLVDVVTDFLKLVTYVGFFALILTFYSLPLNMVRDVYFTARSFFGRIRDFLRYRAATRNMDSRFPDATVDDMRTSDGTCIICREDMIVRSAATAANAGDAAPATQDADEDDEARPSALNETPKKLPCGHIFHFHCLRSWLERQQSCPTCRRTVFTQEGDATAAATPVAPAGPPAPGAPAVGGAAGARGQAPPAAGGAAEAGAAPAAPRPILGSIQEYLQQLRTEAQRVRDTGNADAVRAGRRGAAGGAGQDEATAAPGSGANTPRLSEHAPGATTPTARSRSSIGSHTAARARVQRALLENLFHPDQLHAAAIAAPAAPAPRSQHAPSQGAGWLSTRNPSSNWLPPPPWTLRTPQATKGKEAPNEASGSEPAAMESSADVAAPAPASSASATEAKSETANATDEGEDRVEPADPADAREAARAAALKRFAALGGSRLAPGQPRGSRAVTAPVVNSSETSTTTKEESTLAQAGPQVQPTSSQPPPAGDPHMLPLFDPSLVEGFDELHRPSLPYPLLSTQASRDHVQLSTGLQAAGAPGAAAASTNGAVAAPLGASLDVARLGELSEDQLRALSQTTREGLEERLRLLGSVQSTIWSTIETLSRALSVMKDEEAPVVEGEDKGAQTTPLPGEEPGADRKGKRAAEGINAPRDASSPLSSSQSLSTTLDPSAADDAAEPIEASYL